MAKSDVGKYLDIVKEVLAKYPNVRDDIGLLYVAVIAEIKGLNYVKNISLYEHFKETNTNEKLPTMSSIVRLNTSIQKEFPELRGIKWKDRQKHSKDYKEDLGYGTNKDIS